MILPPSLSLRPLVPLRGRRRGRLLVLPGAPLLLLAVRPSRVDDRQTGRTTLFIVEWTEFGFLKGASDLQLQRHDIYTHIHGRFVVYNQEITSRFIPSIQTTC